MFMRAVQCFSMMPLHLMLGRHCYRSPRVDDASFGGLFMRTIFHAKTIALCGAIFMATVAPALGGDRTEFVSGSWTGHSYDNVGGYPACTTSTAVNGEVLFTLVNSAKWPLDYPGISASVQTAAIER